MRHEADIQPQPGATPLPPLKRNNPDAAKDAKISRLQRANDLLQHEKEHLHVLLTQIRTVLKGELRE